MWEINIKLWFSYWKKMIREKWLEKWSEKSKNCFQKYFFAHNYCTRWILSNYLFISLRLKKSHMHACSNLYFKKLKNLFSSFFNINWSINSKSVFLMKKSKRRSPSHVTNFLFSVSLPHPGFLLTPTMCRTPPPPSRRVRSRACPVTPSRRTPCPSPIPLACKYIRTQTQTTVCIAKYSIFFFFNLHMQVHPYPNTNDSMHCLTQYFLSLLKSAYVSVSWVPKNNQQ